MGDPRSPVVRVLTSVLFTVALAAFALPFFRAVSDERVSRATGLELAAADAPIAGRYVHAAYEGEVEQLVRQARAPAIVALGAALVGITAAWLPHRIASFLGLAAAVVGTLALFVLWQVTTPTFEPPETDRRYGFWLAMLLFLAAVVWNVRRLRASLAWHEGGHRDYFAPRRES